MAKKNIRKRTICGKQKANNHRSDFKWNYTLIYKKNWSESKKIVYDYILDNFTITRQNKKSLIKLLRFL